MTILVWRSISGSSALRSRSWYLSWTLAREHRVVLALVFEVGGAARGAPPPLLGGELELEVEPVRTRAGRAGRRRRGGAPAGGACGAGERSGPRLGGCAGGSPAAGGARPGRRPAAPLGPGAAGAVCGCWRLGLLRRGGQTQAEGQQQAAEEVGAVSAHERGALVYALDDHRGSLAAADADGGAARAGRRARASRAAA